MRKKIVLTLLVGLLKTGIGYSKDVNFKIGVKDRIQSKILIELAFVMRQNVVIYIRK